MRQSYVNEFSETVQIYTKQLRKYSPLDRETERILIEKAQNGDIDAQNKLIQSNLRFVVKVAKQFMGRGLSLEELIGEGNLGLVKAITKFKIQDDNRLLSYGIWWIKAYMQQAIKDVNETSFFELKEIEKPYDNSPNDYLDDCDDSHEDCTEYMTFSHEIEDHVNDIHYNQKEVIAKLFKQLTEREQFIISSYFGLEDEEKTLDEIGSELNLSIERVRQCKEIAIKKMRSEILCLEENYSHIFD